MHTEIAVLLLSDKTPRDNNHKMWTKLKKINKP